MISKSRWKIWWGENQSLKSKIIHEVFKFLRFYYHTKKKASRAESKVLLDILFAWQNNFRHDRVNEKFVNFLKRKNWLGSKLIATLNWMTADQINKDLILSNTNINSIYDAFFAFIDWKHWVRKLMKHGNDENGTPWTRDKIWLKVDNRRKKIEFQELLENFLLRVHRCRSIQFSPSHPGSIL